jgi:hypothetical protein
MAEGGHAKVPQILVAEVAKYGKIDIVVGKARSVFAETDAVEPIYETTHDVLVPVSGRKDRSGSPETERPPWVKIRDLGCTPSRTGR